MKSHDELKVELEADLPIKLTALQSEAANNPVLYGKWARYMSEFSRLKAAAEKKQEEAVAKAFLYYTGKGDDVCLDHFASSELKYIIPAHEDVAKAKKQVDTADALARFCGEACDAIKQRGFAIKNIVDLRKFENGG